MLTTIRAWWGEHFIGANIGIATGTASNLTVVDLDHRPDEHKDGPAQIAALEAEHGELAPGPIVLRGASAHLYFQYVPELRSINGVLPGVDVKNDGGYVVAPPSCHRTGGRYVWADDSSRRALRTMPPWLIAALCPKPKAHKRRARAATPPAGRPGRARGVPVERQDSTRALIDAIRARLTVDEVLEHYGLEATPTCCPLHDGDNPTAFKMYPDDLSRWHCFTRCDEDERDGDIVDLIQRLEGCSFHEALAIAVATGDHPRPSRDHSALVLRWLPAVSAAPIAPAEDVRRCRPQRSTSSVTWRRGDGCGAAARANFGTSRARGQ